MSRVIEAIVPPGGWHYMQDGVRIPPERADSFDDLCKRVLQFRINNKIPVGDVFNDVQTFVCQFPNQCHGHFNGVIHNDPPVSTQKPRFIDRLIQWADEIRTKGVNIEDGQRYQDRINVCKGCPRARSWDGLCPACSSHLHEVLTMVKKGRLTDITLGCEVYGFDCDTASLVHRSLLPNDTTTPPDNCWMRNV